jgi:hypothetical protein
MQVIYEVREDQALKETLYPIGTSANNILASNKVRSLNKRLEKNRDIFGGLSIKLRNRFNGNVGMFTDAEHKVYKKLEHVNLIKEYRTDFINDKRVEKYQPKRPRRKRPRNPHQRERKRSKKLKKLQKSEFNF